MNDKLPVFIQIDPTNMCNVRCPMCIRDVLKNIGYLEFDKFKRIISQFPLLQRVNLNGCGEPLINRDINLMLYHLKDRDIQVRMVTNATLLDEENSEAIANCIDWLVISIDGAKKETYESIRPGAIFGETIERIKRLVRICENINKNNIFIVVNFVCMELNYREMPDMICMVHGLGIKNINFKMMNTDWDYGDVENASDKIIKRVEGLQVKNLYSCKEKIVESIKRSEEFGVNVLVNSDIQLNFQASSCEWTKRCFITWDGYVTPCCMRPEPEIINFGNILYQSAEEIWNSTPYRHFRSQLLMNQLPKVCIRCPSKEISSLEGSCSGGLIKTTRNLSNNDIEKILSAKRKVYINS